MMEISRLAVVVGVAWVLGLPVSAAKPKVEDVYKLNCASCHGEALDRGLGGSLVDGQWKYGGSDQEIAHSIAEGIPDMGMPSYKKTIPPDMIRALVVYIREKESTHKRSAHPGITRGMDKAVITQHGTHRVEPVVSSGLEMPWALAFLPDGRKLVTERGGSLRIFDRDWNPASEPVSGIPKVVAKGQGGLLDVAPAPDFETSGWIYLAYSAPVPGAPADSELSMTKVSRGRLVGNQWTDEETVFEADPGTYSQSGVHFGTRIVFDRGHVYFAVGDRGAPPKAQELGSPFGKIFRVLPDGKIPHDNPFAGREGALATVWSYGHRNPQGLVVDPSTHEIYSTEHGPRGGDEFNLIRKGANYGWPLAGFGMNYNGTPVSELTELEGTEAPLHHWTPSIAACGLTFYGGDKFPHWRGDFFAGGLRGTLHRLRMAGGKVVEDEVVLEGMGRVRDVRSGPDGLIYVVLNGPDKIVRLVPGNPDQPEGP